MKLRSHQILSISAAALTAMLPTIDAQAVTVKKGERFVVDFHLPAVAVNRNPSDTVFFTLDGAGAGMATQGTAELLDGASVLGSDVSVASRVIMSPFGAGHCSKQGT